MDTTPGTVHPPQHASARLQWAENWARKQQARRYPHRLLGATGTLAGATTLAMVTWATSQAGPAAALARPPTTGWASARPTAATAPGHSHAEPHHAGHHGATAACSIIDHPTRDEQATHSLAHGTVWLRYQPALDAEQAATLHVVPTSRPAGALRPPAHPPTAA